jgi:hypothetical protein
LANPKSWGFLGANSHSRPDVEYKTMMEWINLEMHNPKLIAVTHYMVKNIVVSNTIITHPIKQSTMEKAGKAVHPH